MSFPWSYNLLWFFFFSLEEKWRVREENKKRQNAKERDKLCNNIKFNFFPPSTVARSTKKIKKRRKVLPFLPLQLIIKSTVTFPLGRFTAINKHRPSPSPPSIYLFSLKKHTYSHQKIIFVSPSLSRLLCVNFNKCKQNLISHFMLLAHRFHIEKPTNHSFICTLKNTRNFMLLKCLLFVALLHKNEKRKIIFHFSFSCHANLLFPPTTLSSSPS